MPKHTYYLAGPVTANPWRSVLAAILAQSDFAGSTRCIAFYHISAAEEHTAMGDAHAIVFWFPEGDRGMTALYELGLWMGTTKPVFLGLDPKYQYKEKILERVVLVRPDLNVVFSLHDLAAQMVTDAVSGGSAWMR